MQAQTRPQHTKCIFYFKYQMKLELIPYIQQQVSQFLTVCQDKVQDAEAIKQLLVVLNKRIKQIDTFFQKQWHDYRAQQILRSRKMLTDFVNKHHNLLAIHKVQQIKEQINHTMSVIIQQQSKSRSRGKGSTLSNEKTIKNMIRINDNSNKMVQPLTNKSQKELIPYNQSLQASPQYKSKLPPKSPARDQKSRDKRKLSSTDSQQLKAKTKSHKVMPKMSPTVPKMSKEQYIAYLRSKKAKA